MIPGSDTYPGLDAFPGDGLDVVDPCEWPVDWSGCGGAPEDYALQRRAEILATSTLRTLTLGRVGGCPITVRPCAQGCVGASDSWFAGHGSTFFPHVGPGGRWLNSCPCRTSCHCGPVMSTVVLQTPVGRIDEVWVHGVLLEPSSYRVDSGGRLVRLDGGEWPSCQDMTQPHDGADAFAVTYLNAHPVSEHGSIAAGILAKEYAAACSGGRCSLPPGVVSVTRQGSTIQIAQDLFSGGLTGIREVDAYTAQFNPHRSRVRPTVYSPDVDFPAAVVR